MPILASIAIPWAFFATGSQPSFLGFWGGAFGAFGGFGGLGFWGFGVLGF